MPDPDAASATGAQVMPDLRRRNVPGAQKTNIPSTADIVDDDPKKARHTV